jgi:hypothetical protein
LRVIHDLKKAPIRYYLLMGIVGEIPELLFVAPVKALLWFCQPEWFFRLVIFKSIVTM